MLRLHYGTPGMPGRWTCYRRGQPDTLWNLRERSLVNPLKNRVNFSKPRRRGSAGALLVLWLAAGVAAGAGEDGVRRLELDQNHWRDHGFALMTPPVRLPTTHDGRDVIQVWLRVPEGQKIRTRYLPDQARHTLTFPPGTRSDRVESLHLPASEGASPHTIPALTIMDVRGTVIESDGSQCFHVLRPRNGEAGAPLTGWSWDRHDGPAQAAATRELVAFARTAGRPVGRGPESAEGLKQLAALNDCAACHQANQRQKTWDADLGAGARPTDASGFYLPLAVLSERTPVPQHRARDLNVDDPFVTVRCGERPARVGRVEGVEKYECADGSLPTGFRDIRAGLRAGDAYTRAVCAARAYLFARMAAEDRRPFAGEFGDCGLR